MGTKKMSLANVQKLSRKEMRKIFGGGSDTNGGCFSHKGCPSGCAVTNNLEFAYCSYCCYA